MLSFLSAVDWRQPLWLLLALQPLLLWLVLRWQQKKQQQKFADEHLLPWLQIQHEQTSWQKWRQKIFSRNTAYLLAWLLFALSLAGPRSPDKLLRAQNEVILDVMVVVDLSRSMKATDIKPSRIRRATLEIYEFLSLVKNARVGITVYAARPHLFVPLTDDFKALKFYLKKLDTLQLPTLGSDASSAISFAQNELRVSAKKHKQVIVWLTDGDVENSTTPALKANIQKANKAAINTFILGLGSEEGGAIPLSGGRWLESAGQAVISQMNATLLREVAELGSGDYQAATNDESDWGILYKQGILKSLEPVKQDETGLWKELFPWTLFPAILFLLMALLPVLPRYSKNLGDGDNSTAGLMLAVFVFLTLLNTPLYADEDDNTQRMATYSTAIEQGIVAYKNTEYQQSKSHFINSVLNAENQQERGIALHNLGNALFQAGDYSSAAEIFTDALRYAPKQQQTINNQKLTVAINIELEKRRNRVFNRGNFAAPNDNAPLFDLPEQIPYMLSTKAVMVLKASLPKLPEKDLNRLLAKNMAQFKLIQGGEELNTQEIKAQQDLEQARIYFMSLEEKTSNALWKRLFEIEEGFPGKLKKPKEIPGVLAW